MIDFSWYQSLDLRSTGQPRGQLCLGHGDHCSGSRQGKESSWQVTAICCNLLQLAVGEGRKSCENCRAPATQAAAILQVPQTNELYKPGPAYIPSPFPLTPPIESYYPLQRAIIRGEGAVKCTISTEPAKLNQLDLDLQQGKYPLVLGWLCCKPGSEFCCRFR